MKYSIVLLTLIACSGCAHTKQSLGKVLGQAAGMASGPCSQKILDTMTTCKEQYPDLPW